MDNDKAVTEPAKGILEKAVGVVPVLYYDLIARIIPGTAFVIAATWGYKPIDTGFTGGAQFALLIGAGYLVGMILTGLSIIWELFWWGIARVLRKPYDAPYRVPDTLDRIAEKDPFTGDVLLKMLAETSACANVLNGFVVLWLIDVCWLKETLLKSVSNPVRYCMLFVLLLAYVYRAVGVCGRTKLRADALGIQL